MATHLSTLVRENGTMVVASAFTDEDSDAVVPNAITWTLTDTAGNVINEREDVEVATPAASINIVLSGADLAIGSNGTGRILTVQWTYDSSLGSDLPDSSELHFSLENMVNVP